MQMTLKLMLTFVIDAEIMISIRYALSIYD